MYTFITDQVSPELRSISNYTIRPTFHQAQIDIYILII